MRVLPLFAFAMLTTPAFAGGVSSSFFVENYEPQGEQSAIVQLRPVAEAPFYPFDKCEMLEIRVKFRPEWFWNRTWTGDDVTSDSHKKALARLSRLAGTEEPIRFGSMGTGLLPDSENPCVARSRGVSILGEGSEGEIEAIYSFHNSI